MLKTFVLLVGFVCHYSIAFAQDAVVSVVKMNILYVGVHNYVEIAVPNVPSDKLEVSIDNGTIEKRADCEYVVSNLQTGIATIKVKANGQITEKKFRVRPMPNPIPMVSTSKKGGLISKNELASELGIITQMENFDIDWRCAVQSFEVVIIPKNGNLFKMSVSGVMFPPDLSKRFNALSSGDKVVIFEITARCPGDTSTRTLTNLNFTIQ